jgi:quercetin dioxygenase-like cupin family protein
MIGKGLKVRRLRVVVAASIIGVVGLLGGAVKASPGSGITGTILAKGSLGEKVKIRTREPSDLVFQEVDLAPGGFTGWHTHPGPLLVVVKTGSLTHLDAQCHVQTYAAGQAFIEPAGKEYVHMGQNLGEVPVHLYVTYVLPRGSPLRDESPPPVCAGLGTSAQG